MEQDAPWTEITIGTCTMRKAILLYLLTILTDIEVKSFPLPSVQICSSPIPAKERPSVQHWTTTSTNRNTCTRKVGRREGIRSSTSRYARPKTSSSSGSIEGSFNVQLNELFKAPVPKPIQEALSIQRLPNQKVQFNEKGDGDIVSWLTAGPGSPGVPRPLWLVILASVPSGLLWYGYYKFAVEEELMQLDLAQGRQPLGFGGYGTLGLFVYGCLLGPIAFILHIPGGLQWTNLGIAFIYYTQFLLYDRVNELYVAEGSERPLPLWWTLPIFFPFDLIVGLRQVHFLSLYWYRKQGVNPPPTDPVADFFPFIGAPRFTWQDFLLTPSLWCKLFASVDKIDRSTLPEPVQEFLKLGTRIEKKER